MRCVARSTRSSPQPALARVDGNRAPRLRCAVETLVGGDALDPAISAASILAKTARDAAMLELHLAWPMYGFDLHKGYPTPDHLSRLRGHGPSPMHRRSFGPVRALLEQGRVRPMSASGDDGAVRRIASRENPLYRELLHLAGSARERRRREASLIEGVHLCDAYLHRHGRARRVVVSETALSNPEVAALLRRLDTPPVVLAPSLFKALSAVEHGVGIALLIDTPRPALPATIELDAVYLDRIQDPGNVGTILRTCAAAGVRRVITAPGTAWCWSPKVLRAGMGAHFHLEIHESVGWAELAPRLRVAVRATASAPTRTFGRPTFARRRSGYSARKAAASPPNSISQATQTVAIPQSPAVDSLNVGVAAALCLYEQMRQRQAGAGA